MIILVCKTETVSGSVINAIELGTVHIQDETPEEIDEIVVSMGGDFWVEDGSYLEDDDE